MHNPEFCERQRMRASAYNIPRFLHCYQETIDGGLILPRGMLGTVASSSSLMSATTSRPPRSRTRSGRSGRGGGSG